ncbi:MAG: hypothetical protein QY330_00245 [Candidatus Dojkabacteria bacterium]|nr:MAG: hypothetical protein QY330_00245 [Candidatus Dojkabacteria bacterium]
MPTKKKAKAKPAVKQVKQLDPIIKTLQVFLMFYSLSYVLTLVLLHLYTVGNKTAGLYVKFGVEPPTTPMQVMLVLAATYVVIGFLAAYRYMNNTASNATASRWIASVLTITVLSLVGFAFYFLSAYVPLLYLAEMMK